MPFKIPTSREVHLECRFYLAAKTHQSIAHTKLEGVKIGTTFAKRVNSDKNLLNWVISLKIVKIEVKAGI